MSTHSKTTPAAALADVAGTATATLAAERHPALTLAPRAPITSLRFFGRSGAALALPSVQRTFTIGTGGCDLVMPHDVSALVAPLHATIERAGSGLRVRDHATAHGVFRALRGPRVAELHVEAGDVLWLADVPLLALDPYLDALRSCVAWCVGLDRHIAIDESIEAIAEGRPIVLLGPRGTDAARLAQWIHCASPQRAGRFLSTDGGALPVIDHVSGSTVFLDLDVFAKLPAPYVARLFDPARGLRVILAASHDRRVRARLDTYRDRVRVVPLCPLPQRRQDVVRLVAIHWRDELRTGRRVEELPRIDEISGYDWPRGLDELRDHSVRLLAYLEHEGLRPAARALGITHQTLAAHFQRIGFPLPDQSDRDAFMPALTRPREEGAAWPPPSTTRAVRGR